ncbi:unnamed protein product [Paramecium primaurelia]|uniref:N-acetylmuramoyl-L-alanine amidase domain-containing protein n=1 Tax=Paramecium primaurelia TaxID=5886 RepID=A0A8S1PQB9_PARPR|nr:unnamed protein product [Paramecium primaurelia]
MIVDGNIDGNNLLAANQNSQLKSTSKDMFAVQVERATRISLVSEKIANEMVVYKVPRFSEKYRNHYNERQGGDSTPITTLIIHYTVINFYRTLEVFTSNIDVGAVSSTYVITQKEEQFQIPSGQIIQIVPEEKRAWHAGISKWQNMSNLNENSIGIELVNEGVNKQNQFVPFDNQQIIALAQLCRIIIQKFNISPVCILGHSDIAPNRKIDPGVFFPWGKLYNIYGIGAWLKDEEQTIDGIKKYDPEEPLPEKVSISFLSRHFKKYGYDIQETNVITNQFSDVLKAFKAHFSCNQNPEKYNDTPDMNDMIWIWGLTAKYRDYLQN